MIICTQVIGVKNIMCSKVIDLYRFMLCVILLSLHPLCGGGDLLFLLGPPAAATCFCSHSKIPTRIISKYLQYAYWPWEFAW